MSGTLKFKVKHLKIAIMVFLQQGEERNIKTPKNCYVLFELEKLKTQGTLDSMKSKVPKRCYVLLIARQGRFQA